MSNGLDFFGGIPDKAESDRFQRPMYVTTTDSVSLQASFGSGVVEAILEVGAYPFVRSTWGYGDQTIQPEHVAQFVAELGHTAENELPSDIRIELTDLLRLAEECDGKGYALISSGP